MAWTVEYARSVAKTVRRLDPQTRSRIRDYIKNRIASGEDPRTLGRALKGPLGELWRYRVGDWRIVCDLQDERLVVLVLAIAHRRDAYR